MFENTQCSRRSWHSATSSVYMRITHEFLICTDFSTLMLLLSQQPLRWRWYFSKARRCQNSSQKAYTVRENASLTASRVGYTSNHNRLCSAANKNWPPWFNWWWTIGRVQRTIICCQFLDILTWAIVERPFWSNALRFLFLRSFRLLEVHICGWKCAFFIHNDGKLYRRSGGLQRWLIVVVERRYQEMQGVSTKKPIFCLFCNYHSNVQSWNQFE